MPSCVEYLVMFKDSDTFCSDIDSFFNLLRTDSRMYIKSDRIIHGKKDVGRIAVQKGQPEAKNLTCFHLKLEYEGALDNESDVGDFNSMLRTIRTIIKKVGDIEILWNDLSSHYASVAYPVIHEVENLMRRLITTFMVLKLGQEWYKDALPSDVRNAVDNNKRRRGNKEHLNILQTLDFNDLGNLLFSKYARKEASDLVAQLQENASLIDKIDLEFYFQKSNWQRYFSTILSCDDKFLSKQWAQLYELRCKVAHNVLMTVDELDRIRELANKVKPILTEAIQKLHMVKVPSDEIDLVSESLIRGISAKTGEFLSEMQRLETSIAKKRSEVPERYRGLTSPNELVSLGILHRSDSETYQKLKLLRVSLSEDPLNDIPQRQIDEARIEASRLIEILNAPNYITELRFLSDQDRIESVESLLYDDSQTIIESGEFCDAMAETSATDWEIDEIIVESLKLGDNDCIVHFSYHATANEHEEDRICTGFEIKGSADVVVDENGLLSYETIAADVDLSDWVGPDEEIDSAASS